MTKPDVTMAAVHRQIRVGFNMTKRDPAILPFVIALLAGMMLIGTLVYDLENIKFYQQLHSLKSANDFGNKVAVADEIANMVETSQISTHSVTNAICSEIVSEHDKPYLVAAVFTDTEATSTSLIKLHQYTSAGNCRHADLIHHIASNSFSRGYSDWGWIFFQQLEECSINCTNCGAAAAATLLGLPVAQHQSANQKLQQLINAGKIHHKLKDAIQTRWAAAEI